MSFIILRSGEGLTSFNKNHRVNFSGKKKVNNDAFRGIYFFENTRTTECHISSS